MKDGKPVLLDLFCGAGGAARGYQQAGFYVVGVDIKPQPRYAGDEFYQWDALNWGYSHSFAPFSAIHASPPCQAWTQLGYLHREKTYPELIEPVRAMLRLIGLPYVIENVPRAPVRRDLVLCGNSFGLRVYRHRAFESSVALLGPAHQRHIVSTASHRARQRKAHFAAGGFLSVTGNIGSYAGAAMGIDWMTGDELSESIPPAYTRYIGEQLLRNLK